MDKNQVEAAKKMVAHQKKLGDGQHKLHILGCDLGKISRPLKPETVW
jgi:hypothetical protein